MKTDFFAKLKNALLIGLVLAIGGVAIHLKVKIENLSDTAQLQRVELSALKDSVSYLTTEKGDLVAKVNSVLVEKDNLKEALQSAGFDLKELKDANVKLRKLNFALKAEIKATGEVLTQLQDTFKTVTSTNALTGEVKVDTIPYLKVKDWSNNHLSIFDGSVFNKDLQFNYEYRVGFLFNKEDYAKHSVVTIKLDDPKAKITTANSITIDKKTPWYQKWWFWGTVGAGAGILIAK